MVILGKNYFYLNSFYVVVLHSTQLLLPGNFQPSVRVSCTWTQYYTITVDVYLWFWYFCNIGMVGKVGEGRERGETDWDKYYQVLSKFYVAAWPVVTNMCWKCHAVDFQCLSTGQGLLWLFASAYTYLYVSWLFEVISRSCISCVDGLHWGRWENEFIYFFTISPSLRTLLTRPEDMSHWIGLILCLYICCGYICYCIY